MHRFRVVRTKKIRTKRKKEKRKRQTVDGNEAIVHLKGENGCWELSKEFLHDGCDVVGGGKGRGAHR